MSAITKIQSSTPYTPPVVSTPSKGNAAASAPAPAAVAPAPAASAPQSSPQVASVAVQQAAAQTAKAAKTLAMSYRNSFGDTVSISGIVLKDRDGDGGVGLPAPKAEAK